ncbi:TetR/AcrR family transcriptional regulator [Apilactobacillus ozensis]|uniref:TetR/AcrR family transcriptional regulator n=1 Tax=Apilactobacillus ozensis TaxID=866801 RepID=UPI00200B8DE9|nr:helix-turn-helix domain-containing protein [Apilactobacillus ozensis]MCK8607200.1 TetR/AcrR family transcriptional regulator [Apilactobacillus ozensis]
MYDSDMGRKKKYDLDDVIHKMKQVFLVNGYKGTSLDDLVKATGLLRGSLYAEFGSKRSMFMAVLDKCINQCLHDKDTWEVILIGMMELSAQDKLVRDKLRTFFTGLDFADLSDKLGRIIIQRSKINGDDYNE